MPPNLSKDVLENLGRAVGDEMLLGEFRRAVDEDRQPDDPRDPVEVSRREPQDGYDWVWLSRA